VVSFLDCDNTTLRGHSLGVKEIIETTPGFAEGIVESFDYENHGFKRVSEY
jgi:hypothetical protein